MRDVGHLGQGGSSRYREKIDRFKIYTGRFLIGLGERVYGEEEGDKAVTQVSE